MFREADREFYELLNLLRDVQSKGGVGLRLEKQANAVDTIMFFESVKNDGQDDSYLIHQDGHPWTIVVDN